MCRRLPEWAKVSLEGHGFESWQKRAQFKVEWGCLKLVRSAAAALGIAYCILHLSLSPFVCVWDSNLRTLFDIIARAISGTFR